MKIMTDMAYERHLQYARNEAVDKWREQRDIDRRFMEMEERITRLYQQIDELRCMMIEEKEKQAIRGYTLTTAELKEKI